MQINHIDVYVAKEKWEKVSKVLLETYNCKLLKSVPNSHAYYNLNIIEVNKINFDDLLNYLNADDDVIRYEILEVVDKLTSNFEFERRRENIEAKVEIEFDLERLEHKLTISVKNKDGCFELVRFCYFRDFKKAIESATHSLLSI